jgi:iron(III) transport system permease protein
LCTIVHFYTTGHLTAVTALKALDAEFEAVSVPR